MKHPIPTNSELLVELAAKVGLDYQDAYYIWTQVNEEQEPYMIIEAVLYISKMHRLPVYLALTAYELQFSKQQDYELTDWVTA